MAIHHGFVSDMVGNPENVIFREADQIISATGVESPDIPQPPAFPPAPAPLPPPTSAPSPTDTTSSETGTCSKQEAAYVSDLGSCLYTHPVYMFGYSLAGSECAEVGGSLIELQTETKFLDVVIAVVDPGSK